MNALSNHPVLSLDAAKRFEDELFGGDETREWPAMQRAGRAVADAVRNDFRELGVFPPATRLLVLAGKGHNAGDAFIAAQALLAAHPDAHADLWLLFGDHALRALAARAYRELVHAAPQRVRLIASAETLAPAYDLSLDGVFGFQFRPPLTAKLAASFALLNNHPIRFRAAVDLPSGLGDANALRADFTYATGSVKTPTLDPAHLPTVGRLRYLDLSFFSEVGRGVPAEPSDVPLSAENSEVGRMVPHPPSEKPATDFILTPDILAPLRRLRAPSSDKRTYGHLFLLGGSRTYPGAIFMSALAAARSGVGLLTAFVPESLVPSFATRLPEVIWIGWPETPAGGLALEGFHLLRERLDRASALLLGPGLGREPETLALVADLAKASTVPLVIDADALQPEIIRAGSAPRILTPHAGEFARISSNASLLTFSRDTRAVTVLKGPLTAISDGNAVYHSCHGGPVLARGGSGDILAGLIGGLLAQHPAEPLKTACRGVVWQGLAADLLARTHGQIAVQTTQILDHLAAALRNEGP